MEKPQFKRDILTVLYSFLRKESSVCHLGNGPRGMKSTWISTVVWASMVSPHSIGFLVHNHTLGWVHSLEQLFVLLAIGLSLHSSPHIYLCQ